MPRLLRLHNSFGRSNEITKPPIHRRLCCPPIKPKLWQGLMSGTPSRVAASFADVEARDKRLYCDKLASKLSSSSVGERIAALTAVFVIRDQNLSGHLLRMAKDSSSSVRRFAVFYLGELRAKYSIPVVNGLLSDESPEVRAAARDANRKIGGPECSIIRIGLRSLRLHPQTVTFPRQKTLSRPVSAAISPL